MFFERIPSISDVGGIWCIEGNMYSKLIEGNMYSSSKLHTKYIEGNMYSNWQVYSKIA
jgi:hypothetical protein